MVEILCRITYGNDRIPQAKTIGTDQKFSSKADLHLEKP